MTTKEQVVLTERCDGYTIEVNGKEYVWDHENESFIKHLNKMFGDLGYEVKVVEDW